MSPESRGTARSDRDFTLRVEVAGGVPLLMKPGGGGGRSPLPLFSPSALSSRSSELVATAYWYHAAHSEGDASRSCTRPTTSAQVKAIRTGSTVLVLAVLPPDAFFPALLTLLFVLTSPALYPSLLSTRKITGTSGKSSPFSPGRVNTGSAAARESDHAGR